MTLKTLLPELNDNQYHMLKRLIEEIIGEDEPSLVFQHKGYKTPSMKNNCRNQLRTEQRNKLKELMD